MNRNKYKKPIKLDLDAPTSFDEAMANIMSANPAIIEEKVKEAEMQKSLTVPKAVNFLAKPNI